MIHKDLSKLRLLESLNKVIDSQKIYTSEEAQELYPCCSQIRTPILGSVSAESTEDVRSVLTWANENKVAIYVISTGNNWGYGGGHPSSENALILYLGHMNRTLSFDEKLGIIEIEPGVSQKILHDFLEKQNEQFYTPVTGSSPHSSVLANALERGYGVTPLTDHFAAIQSVTSVAADGTLYTHQDGPDPFYKHGLFSQSNLGIVTSAKITLSKKSEAHAVLIFGVDDKAEIEHITKLSHKFYAEAPHLMTSVKFFNLAYLIALNAEFPDQAAHQQDFDIENWLLKEKKKQSSPEWMCAMFLCGSRDMVKSGVRQYKTALRPHCKKMMIFTEFNIRLLKGLTSILDKLPENLFKPIKHKLHSALAMFSLLRGVPQTRFLKAAYWRAGKFDPSHRDKKPNPGKDGAGLIWFAPIVPFRGSSLLELNALIQSVCLAHDFFPVVSITTISQNALSCLVPILFDPKTEKERAHACYEELIEKCKASGYLPYRGHVNYLDRFSHQNTAHFWPVVSKIKTKLDPNLILSPGRYDGRAKHVTE